MDKKTLIKTSAYDLFISSDFELASVNQIVAKAQVAKGTYYLYYKTKEEVYLDILYDFYQKWFEHINNELINTSSIDSFLKELVKSFTKDTKFLELLSRASLILEKNITKEIIYPFKKGHQDDLLNLSKNIANHFKRDIKETTQNLLMTYTYIIGLYQTSKLPATLDTKELNSLSQTRLDFELEVDKFIKLIWR
ncbi:TetR family transcriptional regulator [Halobacteriovorax sp. XZX-3]|uniref:TetR family transcriptional regulator n=1 Tax=unclassified Halobacteriovorax TaxID=2639665 RepID=UPI003718353A